MERKQLSQSDKKLWRKVTEDVTPLGEPQKPSRARPAMSYQIVTTIDLHGYTIHEAYSILREYLHDCKYNNLKEVTVITGKSVYPLETSIRKEFPHWMETSAFSIVKSYTEKNGGGAFSIKLY